jgi:hypothetical protein
MSVGVNQGEKGAIWNCLDGKLRGWGQNTGSTTTSSGVDLYHSSMLGLCNHNPWVLQSHRY